MRLHALLIALALSLTACFGFDSDEPPPPGDTDTGATFRTYDEGELWAPCWRGPDGAELGGWGCYGDDNAEPGPGRGYACYKPDGGRLDICVPQLWDANTPVDCAGLDANFGLGVEPDIGGTYCVIPCIDDADCEGTEPSPPRACSAQGTCAYVFLGS